MRQTLHTGGLGRTRPALLCPPCNAPATHNPPKRSLRLLLPALPLETLGPLHAPAPLFGRSQQVVSMLERGALYPLLPVTGRSFK